MTENKTISNYNRIAVRQSKPIKRNHSNKTIVKPPPKSKHKKKIKKIKKIKDPQAQLQPVKKKNKRKRRTKRNKRKLIKMSSTVITADADQPSTPPRYHSKTIAYPAQLPTPPNYHSNRTVDAPQPNTPRRYYSKNKPHISQNYCTNNTTNESRTNKSINDFISRRKKGKLKHIGANPFSIKDNIHGGNCTPRELVPIVNRMCSHNTDHEHSANRLTFPQINTKNANNQTQMMNQRKAYTEPKPHGSHRVKHAHAKKTLKSQVQRQECNEIQKEIKHIMTQRCFYLDHLKQIFCSLDGYLRKLDDVRTAKTNNKKMETILCKFDKNIVYYLRDLRKVTWNLVFFLKSIQTRSKRSLT
eukprot:922215_1